jgi:hypothetical protein
LQQLEPLVPAQSSHTRSAVQGFCLHAAVPHLLYLLSVAPAHSPAHMLQCAEGEYACPVTGKVFTPHSHIVALKSSGNVYSYDAVDELCIKPKNWKVRARPHTAAQPSCLHVRPACLLRSPLPTPDCYYLHTSLPPSHQPPSSPAVHLNSTWADTVCLEPMQCNIMPPPHTACHSM